MFVVVSHTIRHLFCRIRSSKSHDGDRVRYETVQGRDYDLTDDKDRNDFNWMHQFIQASSHFYGKMYKEAICKALQSGISPDTTDSDDIYFAYSQRDGKIFYTMKHGDTGYLCYDEPYRFLDEAGHQVIDGSGYIDSSDEVWTELMRKAFTHSPLKDIQAGTKNLDKGEESSVCSAED